MTIVFVELAIEFDINSTHKDIIEYILELIGDNKSILGYSISDKVFKQ